MAGWTAVATVPELRRRRRMQVTAADQTIALFWVDGEVYALRDVCIHKERSLSRGALLHGRIICPGHQWAFDPATGWVEEQQRCAPTYDVRVDEETIYVDPTPRLRREEPADRPPSEVDDEGAVEAGIGSV